MPQEVITVRLDPQQVEEITRDITMSVFRCNSCKHFKKGIYHPNGINGWGYCERLAIAGMTITDQASIPLPGPTVHEDFGCNRFEEAPPLDPPEGR